MSKSAVELRQQRAEIAKEMNNIIVSATPDMARWKQLNAEQEQLRVRIEATESTNQLQSQMSSYDRRAAQLPNINADPFSPERSGVLSVQDEVRKSARYRDVFDGFVRTGDMREVRALGAVSAVNGYTLVPIGFQKEVATYLKAVGGLRSAARIVTTPTGNPLNWPREQDTSNNGHWLAESAPITETDPTFDSVTLGADLLSSDSVLVPVELIQDSAFSVEALLAESFGKRLARGTATAYMNGNGANILGLLPELVSAGGRSVLPLGANANSGNSGDTEINSLGTDDWAALITALDPAYRLNAKFAANQATFDAMRKIKDKYGRPIWEVSLAEGQADKIFGYPYFFDQSLPTVAAGATGTVIFGDFNQYIIRDVLNMTIVRYNELYMPNHQIGFEAFLRTFGKLLIAPAFAYLQTRAS